MTESPHDLVSLFTNALELAPASREKLLRSCEPEIRHKVVELLNLHEQASLVLTRLSAESALPDGAPVTSHSSVLHALNGQPEMTVTPIALPESDSGDTTPQLDIPLQSGQRYQIQGEIARGGMGAILKGRDIDLGRTLAVKVLLESHRNDPNVIRRFIEEAQIGGQLQHPGIVPVYELGRMDDRPFFTMKLVKGQTLSALLRERNSPEDDRGRFVGIFEQVCQTLAYAHSRRVIHRDLKPSNIMVGDYGEVQVMDWGLAKVLPAGGIVDEKKALDSQQGKSIVQTLRSVGSSLPGAEGSGGSDTMAGSVMGTLAYMPPEQALGEVDLLDERADVFGLGAILCEILTGKPPYTGRNATEIHRLAARGKTEAAISRLTECGADPGVVSIARDCLNVEPRDRPRDAGVLSERLASYLESVEVRLRETEVQRANEATRLHEDRKRYRLVTALAASIVLVIGIAGTGGWWLNTQEMQRRALAVEQVNAAVSDVRLQQGKARGLALAQQVPYLDQAVAHATRAVEIAAQEGVADRLRMDASQLLETVTQEADTNRAEAAAVARAAQLRSALETIRLNHAEGEPQLDVTERDSNFDTRKTHNAYADAFRNADLDLERLTVNDAAARIAKSRIRETLVSAIDHWSRVPSHGRSLPLNEVIVQHCAINNWSAAEIAAREWRANHDGRFPLGPEQLHAIVAAVKNAPRAAAEVRRKLLTSDASPESPPATQTTSILCCLLAPAPESPDEPAMQRLIQSHRRRGLRAPRQFALAETLIAYREGDLPSTMKQANAEIEALPATADTSSATHGWLADQLLLRAMAEFRTGQPEAARSSYRKAEDHLGQIVGRSRGTPHRLLPLCLMREAYELIFGTPDSSVTYPWSETTRLPVAVTSSKFTAKLSSIANAADDSEWRISLRTCLVDQDLDTLKKLASSDELTRQPAETLAWLGEALRQAKAPKLSAQVLSEVQGLHPGDFWINYQLARSLIAAGEPKKAEGYARAALAVRPDSIGANWIVVAALDESGQPAESLRIFNELLSRSDMTAREYAEMATELRRRGKPRQAVAAARRAIAEDEEDGNAYVELSRALVGVGEIKEAIIAAKSGSGLLPGDSDAFFHLGRALAKQDNRSEAAADAYRHAIELNPASTHALNNLGMIHLRSDRLQEAASRFREALEIDPDYSLAQANLGNALSMLFRQDRQASQHLLAELAELRSKRFAGRRSDITGYRRTLKLNQWDAATRLKLAAALMQVGKIDAAKSEYLEVLRQDETNVEARKKLGTWYLRQDRIDDAVREFRILVEHSEDWQSESSLAMALHRQATGTSGAGPPPHNLAIQLTDIDNDILDESLQRYTAAISLIDQDNASRSDTNDQVEELRARVGYVRALRHSGQAKHSEIALADLHARVVELGADLRIDSLWQLGDIGEIHDAVNQILTVTPHRVEFMVWLAQQHLLEGDGARAQSLLEEVLARDGSHLLAHLLRAEILTLQKRYDEATQRFQRLREADPRPPFTELAAGLGIGAVLLEQDRVEEAIAELEQVRAAEGDPRLRGLMLTTLAEAYYREGDVSHAESVCREVLESLPEFGPAHDRIAICLLHRHDEAGNRTHLAEALQHANQACRRHNPDDVKNLLVAFHTTRGMVYFRMGKTDEALNDLSHARTLHDELPALLQQSVADPLVINWLVSAMAHAGSGNQAAASQWHRLALDWAEENKPNAEQQLYFDEAESFLTERHGEADGIQKYTPNVQKP